MRFISSMKYALRGIVYLLKTERNFRIQFVIGVLVIIAGLYFQINKIEWASVLLCIGLVMGLEGMNTAVERMMDKIHPGQDEEVGRIKDIAAGAVLVASILSAIAGIVVFLPYLREIMN